MALWSIHYNCRAWVLQPSVPALWTWHAIMTENSRTLFTTTDSWFQTTATAAAKSLQSCPTLCDGIDSSPPGSSVHGILQTRILEWVASPFSNACMHACMLSHFSLAWLRANLWTAAHQAPLSTGFSRHVYWSGLPFPSPISSHTCYKYWACTLEYALVNTETAI